MKMTEEMLEDNGDKYAKNGLESCLKISNFNYKYFECLNYLDQELNLNKPLYNEQ